MLIEHQHPDNKSIMVSVLGAPNVGKSSLINNLLGTDLSVVTHLPQTTRNRFSCIFTIDRTEIILVDTPGLHKSSQEFNKRLNEQAREGADGVDLNLLLVDLTKPLMEQIRDFQELVRKNLTETWLVLTKLDLVPSMEDHDFTGLLTEAQTLVPSLKKVFAISSKSDLNIHLLTGALCDRAEPGPHHYEDGSLSNKNERFFVSEYIRQQAFELLKDELPYEIAVVIDDYQDLVDRKEAEKKKEPIVSKISATILVNRPSQRAIVVGSGGSMIKEIGSRARRRIEELLGGQIHLNLHVKVAPKWFKNNFILEELGLPRAQDSRRVWKKR
jgi:GTPase